MNRQLKTGLTLLAIGSAMLLSGCQTHKEPIQERQECRANVMLLDDYTSNNCHEDRISWKKQLKQSLK